VACQSKEQACRRRLNECVLLLDHTDTHVYKFQDNLEICFMNTDGDFETCPICDIPGQPKNLSKNYGSKKDFFSDRQMP